MHATTVSVQFVCFIECTAMQYTACIMLTNKLHILQIQYIQFALEIIRNVDMYTEI